MICHMFITLLVKESQDKIISWLATNGYTITVNNSAGDQANKSAYILSMAIQKPNTGLTTKLFSDQLRDMCEGSNVPYHSMICIAPDTYIWHSSNIKMKPRAPKPKVNVPHLKVVKSEDQEQKQD